METLNRELTPIPETGWKMDGGRWQLWCLCNRDLAYFHADTSRGSQVLKDRLGEDYAGIVHCDFYAGYNFLPRTQRCLIHLKRDVDDEYDLHPDDPFLAQLQAGVNAMIHGGRFLQKGPATPSQRLEIRQQLEQEVETLANLKPPDGRAKTLVERIQTHRASLLWFTEHPQVEFHNNRAERQLRPAVIFRKISFGNRTPEGARRQGILATVIQTCRLQGQSVIDYLKRAITAPASDLPKLARELIDTS